MLVEALKDLPYFGKKGTVRDLPKAQADILVMLGKVKPAAEVKKRRVYRRRDMRSAPVAQVVEPELVAVNQTIRFDVGLETVESRVARAAAAVVVEPPPAADDEPSPVAVEPEAE